MRRTNGVASGRAVSVALLLLTSVAVLAAAPPAPARAAKQARILAPPPGAFFAAAKLRVVVSAPPGKFRAWLGTKEITKAFERRGKRRVAELDRSRLRAGVEHIYVKAGGRRGSFDSARFVVARRQAPGLLDARAPRLHGKLGPAAVTANRPVRASMRAYLNGRRLRGEFEHVSGKSFRGSLGADEGARFGPNVLRLVAFDERGTYDVETVRFRLSGRRPLASAGPERHARVGQRVRLDARASRAATGRGELEYRWRIVGSPRGAKGRAAAASLRRARSARPHFRPPRAGTWRIAVTVRHRSGGPASRDITTVESVPADPPIGAPLRTIADPNGRIDIGGEPVGGTGVPGSTISYAMLGRNTRMPAKICAGSIAPTGSVPSNAAGVSTLLELVERCQQPSYLLILDGTHGVPAAALDQFGKLLAGVGASLAAADRNRLAAGASFSVIGIPSAPAGAAFANFGRQKSTDPARPLPAGALTGLLQFVTATREYGFVFPDYIPFDTQSAHAGKSNTMTIGGVKYEGELGEGTAGFHVVILDPSSLAIRKDLVPFEYDPTQFEEIPINYTFTTNRGYAKADQETLEYVAKFLREYVIEKGGLLFMQSINNPTMTVGGWDAVAQVIEKLGGSRSVFNQIAGGGYAVVAGPEMGFAEASASLTKDPSDGHLTGLLTRNRNTGFGPGPGSAAPASGQELMRILYQPAQPFPAFAKAGEQAADEYISKQLFGEDAKGGTRPQYWQSWGASWENKNQQMRNQVPFPGAAKCGCEQPEFEAVKETLGAEMTKLADVQKWLATMDSTLNPTQAAFDLREVGHAIEQLVRPPDRETGSTGLKLMGGAIGLLGKVDPAAEEAASGGAALVDFLGGLQTGGDGSPVLGEVKAKTSDLAAQLFPRFELARSGLTKAGMIVASDWGKLQAVAKKATGAWKIEDPTAFRTAINKSTRRWFYAELMKTAWVLWELEADNARNWTCFTGGGEAIATQHPFSAEPESGQYRAALGMQADMTPATIVRGLGLRSTFNHPESVDDSSAQPPNAALTDPLFKPANLDPASSGLGLYPQQFYELNFERAWPPGRPGKHCGG